MQATFEKLENELREVNQNAEALERSFLELTELRHILHKTQIFFDEVSFQCISIRKKHKFLRFLMETFSFRLFYFNVILLLICNKDVPFTTLLSIQDISQ